MMMLTINIFGILLIGFIIWWFWLAKPKKVVQLKEQQPVEIIVQSGVYMPDLIQGTKNQTLTLRFIRKDSSPCAEAVIFSDLNISSDLPVERPKDVILKVEKSGIYEFTCPMGMYRGKLMIQ